MTARHLGPSFFLLLVLVAPTLPAAGNAPAEEASSPAPFLEAVRQGDIATVEKLLEEKVDLEQTDAAGLTAIQVARVRGFSELVELLEKHGAKGAAPLPPPESCVARALEALFPETGPGATVLVGQRGKVLFEGAYGEADSESHQKMETDTSLRIGSVTKQFTAVAILKLAEAGKLRVSDSISRFYPDFPRGDEITVHHLLTHTSGIQSYTDLPDFSQKVVSPVSPEEVVAKFRDLPLAFAPGEKWAYCNSGYFLLGLIVEKLSGKSYGEFLEEIAFEPLGMKRTEVHRRDDRPQREARGYKLVDGKAVLAKDWDMTWAGGAGALASTVGDLFRWNEGVFGGRVVSRDSLERALTPVKLAPKDGGPDENDYGYGWGIGEFRGLRVYAHGGGLDGFASMLGYVPAHGLTIAVLSNASSPRPGASPGEIFERLLEQFLWSHMEPQEVRREQEDSSPEELAEYVGRYDYGGPLLEVTLEDGRLFAQLTGQPKFPIFRKEKDVFFWKVARAQLTFRRDEKGKITGGLHEQGGQELEVKRLSEVRAIELAEKDLDKLTGKYDYGAAILPVRRDGKRLLAKMEGQPEYEIFPTSATEFHWKVVEAKIVFHLDDKGNVTHGRHYQGGREFDVKKVE